MTTQLSVTAEGLNVRSGPTTNATVVAGLGRGDLVTLISLSGDGLWFKVTLPSGKEGWVRNKFVAAVPDQVLTKPGDPPWMVIANAEIGMKEYPGNGENPRILEYLRSTTLAAPDSARDETPWCSAFANWCVERSGYEGTDSAWARSWLNWGVAIDKPQRGCITVFTRDGNKGHVAFYLGSTSAGIKVLGGNQSNAVCVSVYRKSDVLGYRLPHALTSRVSTVSGGTSKGTHVVRRAGRIP
jgi:uncharacterized protein (TIGR02594 family)